MRHRLAAYVTVFSRGVDGVASQTEHVPAIVGVLRTASIRRALVKFGIYGESEEEKGAKRRMHRATSERGEMVESTDDGRVGGLKTRANRTRSSRFRLRQRNTLIKDAFDRFVVACSVTCIFKVRIAAALRVHAQ